MKRTLETGVTTRWDNNGHIKVYSPILDEDTRYNDVTSDTELLNQLKGQLIKLHSI